MDYSLLYTQRALNDLAEILGKIAEDNEVASSLFGTSLLDHIDLLVHFPRMGGVVWKRTGVRKLVHSPILVYYQIDARKRIVEVLHLRHGARKPPRSALQIKRNR